MVTASAMRTHQLTADDASLAAFCARVRSNGVRYNRALPWRFIDDAYGVYVSEVMLQQTQVVRVLDYWPRFMHRLPTIDALAAASTGDVLQLWQGLGYNRRALALKRSAEICARDFGGVLPHSYDDLVALPGIGPATAAGIRAFAFDEPGVYLETNVRTVFIHELFADVDDAVSDKELIPLVRATCPDDGVREWYYALLDYGAHLKKTAGNAARKSRSYKRQSAFEGSHRQKRAAVVRIMIAERNIAPARLLNLLNEEEREQGRPDVADEEFNTIVTELSTEGFVTVEGANITLR